MIYIRTCELDNDRATSDSEASMLLALTAGPKTKIYGISGKINSSL